LKKLHLHFHNAELLKGADRSLGSDLIPSQADPESYRQIASRSYPTVWWHTFVAAADAAVGGGPLMSEAAALSPNAMLLGPCIALVFGVRCVAGEKEDVVSANRQQRVM
jgi:hypothetical protein